jgi:hypothetical protein
MFSLWLLVLCLSGVIAYLLHALTKAQRALQAAQKSLNDVGQPERVALRYAVLCCVWHAHDYYTLSLYHLRIHTQYINVCNSLSLSLAITLSKHSLTDLPALRSLLDWSSQDRIVIA